MGGVPENPSNSYSTATVTGLTAGGLFGEVTDTGPNTSGGVATISDGVMMVDNAYFSGRVSGTTVGTIIGFFNSARYPTERAGGGLFLTNVYWDSYLNGQTGPVGASLDPTLVVLNNVNALTSDPAQAGAANYLYNPAAWSFTNVANYFSYLSPIVIGANALDTTGGQELVWRMYAGSTTPLLTSRLVEATVSSSLAAATVNYSGLYQAGATDTVGGYSVPSGLDNSQVLGRTLYSCSGGDAGCTNAGSYTVTADRLYSTQFGYDFSYASTGSAALTINAIPLTVTYTANSASSIYGNTPSGLTGTVSSLGLVNGESLANALTGTASWAAGATGTSGVGTYGITGSGLTASTNNYIISFQQAAANATALSVIARALNLTPDAVSRIYGNANTGSGTASDTSSGANTGLVNGDTITSVSLSSLAGATSNVGSYGLTASNSVFGQGAASNYSISYTANATGLSVTQRALSVTANAQTMAYGDAVPNLDYVVAATDATSGLVNGDTLAGSLATTASSTTNVGSYGITQGTLAGGGNYTVSFTGANVTIGQRALTVESAAVTRPYGNANPATAIIADFSTSGGLVNGDTLTVGSISSPADATSNVGSYALTVSNATFGHGLASNYNITYSSRPTGLIVARRGVVVTAGNQSMVYGAAVPTLTYSVGAANANTGLINGDTLTGILATSASSTANVGSYSILTGTLTAGSNYVISLTGGNTVSITARALSLTPDAVSRVYGDANPGLGTASDTSSGANTGLVNGDTVASIALSSGALATSGVGSYVLTGSGAVFGQGAASNYSISYVGNPTGLGVTARPLTVTADAQTMVYGGTLPSLTYAVGGRGLVNGDTLSGALAAAGGSSSSVGSYSITQWPAAGFEDTEIMVFDRSGGVGWRDVGIRASTS